MTMSVQPLGIFDSGVGGTSIWKEINNLLPYENTIYLADSKNAPYGEKSAEEIVALSVKNTEFLIAHGCKLIVVACNTATTNAITHLRTRYSVPFIGIEPAIKPAALNSISRKIGILATKGTLSSALFHQTSKNVTHGIHLIEQNGEGLVPLIEQGKINDDKTRQLLEKYLNPMVAEGIDYLVLGCTHYPYLIPLIKTILPEHIQIIDSGEAVARQTKNILEQQGLLGLKNKAVHQFYGNADITVLKAFLTDFSVEIAYQDF
jgi:glutamate racemase